ncbi:hypothetical protein BDZ94DRAFT_1379089 [Collybia nuda]|uniref:Uncharacterized protein n=1 Tax=Collybia nuda TaxID=64659 RepID=A0A9P5YGL4_9AGAR|nr:hypothetical protein BDZ94DRAFT_1379089 [Collybia nuda]
MTRMDDGSNEQTHSDQELYVVNFMGSWKKRGWALGTELAPRNRKWIERPWHNLATKRNGLRKGATRCRDRCLPLSLIFRGLLGLVAVKMVVVRLGVSPPDLKKLAVRSEVEFAGGSCVYDYFGFYRTAFEDESTCY